MTCDECFEAFSASLDGELVGDQLESMNVHLDHCLDCQRLRAKLLTLSAEMKAQPFPEPTADAAHRVALAALAGATASRWSVLKRWLRSPYENWPLRHGLRFATFAGATALVTVSIIARWLLPPYLGLEAAAKRGLPDMAWLDWEPSAQALSWAPLIVVLLAAWTGGLPSLLSDLWGDSRLTHRQVGASALGLAVAGPFASLPLLADLELGVYVLACCFWAGLCLLAAFALVAFKTSRPLPQLVIDFVALILPLGLLEGLARSATALPRAEECQPAIALLVGSLPFPTLAGALAVLAVSTTLLGCGVAGLIPSYRGSGGRWLSLLLLFSGIGCLSLGIAKVRPQEIVSPLRVELQEQRTAYLLAPSETTPWILPSVEYPGLSVAVAGPGRDPRAARLRLASAYLDWDEERTLQAVRSWAEQAPGVAWGLSAFVDSLGHRQGPTLTLPSEERQKLVADLLQELRWRVLAESVLSSATGSVSGRIEGPQGKQEGLRLRLIKVDDQLATVTQILQSEAKWAAEMAQGDKLDVDFSPPFQRTVFSGVDGEFELTRVPDGRYVLALLPESPLSLLHNPTIPGVFEVRGGHVRLNPIILTIGSEGHDLPLVSSSWQADGEVSFAVDNQGPHAFLQAGSGITTLADGKIFSTGTARVKVLTQGETVAGQLTVTFLSKEGRRLVNRELSVSGPGVHEIAMASGDRQGYLQVSLRATAGPWQVRAVKIEVLP